MIKYYALRKANLMAANEPIPMNAYTRVETDMKLENTLYRVDAKLDKQQNETHNGFTALRNEVHNGFAMLRNEMQNGFTELRADMRWLKSIVMYIGVPMMLLNLSGIIAILVVLAGHHA